MSSIEALNIAAASQPVPPAASAPFPEGPKLGATVLICADDYRRQAIGGQLVYLDAEENVDPALRSPRWRNLRAFPAVGL